MEVEGWLARAAAERPARRRCDAREALVLRRAAARAPARAPARLRRAARAPGRAWRSRFRPVGRVRAGAARVPAARRGRGAARPASRAGRARRDRRRLPGAACKEPLERGPQGARGRRCGAHDLDAAPRDPHLRHDGRAAAGRADLRELALERARLGRRARPERRRALAVRAAAVARRRASRS